MPYVTKEAREDYDPAIDNLIKYLVGDKYPNRIDPGILNYIVTRILIGVRPSCYQDYNSLVGMLECCKQEFYRRAVASYEDEKIKENGDCY